MVNSKRKRTVEIYFILYLAALVFLIPETGQNGRIGKGTGIKVYPPRITVFPDKTSLTCKAIIDSSGPRILSLDSLNTIYYTGDVENIEFVFKIEDQQLKQSFNLTSDHNPTTKFFRMEKQTNKQAANFYWIPPIKERTSKTYLVTVMATVKTKPNYHTYFDNKEDEASQIFTIKTQFSLIMIFLNNGNDSPLYAQSNYPPFDPNDPRLRMLAPFQNTFEQVPTGKIDLINENDLIRTIAYQQWTQTIHVTNIDLLKDAAKIDLKHTNSQKDNGGEAEILDVGNSRVIIHGKTPKFGDMIVEFSVVRKYDNQIASSTFKVRPERFEDPEYERNMYPDENYNIDPKLPLIGRDVKAIIKDGSLIRARSNQGEVFKFTPLKTDINKTLYLERYVDSNLLGQRMAIYILDFPVPTVEIQQRNENEVEVITKSYKYVSGDFNEVIRFELEGNAKYFDLRGRISDNLNPVYRTQHFIFKPDDPKKPFKFKIIAIDKRGKRSEFKTYNGG